MSRSITFACAALMACSSLPPAETGSDAGPTDAGSMSQTCETHEVTCVDQSIATLDLFTTVATGAITEEGTMAGEFTTHVDARAGGSNVSQSFVYAKFTDSGLRKVSIDDESALASTEWDIAFRRYIIRVNSGVSGPSCVQVARTAPATTFDGLTTAPSNLAYRTESYFGDTCDFVSDATGLNAPVTTMASFWTYSTCVRMTGYVYVVALADGRHVKLQVQSYYAPASQQECETSGTGDHATAGEVRIRWAFLP